MADETCKTCRFFEQYALQCRRYPPVIVTRPRRDEHGPSGSRLNSSTGAEFPEVHGDDWCGEWQKTKDGV